MKKILAVLFAGLFLVTVSVAGETVKKGHNKHPKAKCFQSASVQEQFSSLVGYPSAMMHGTDQTVTVSFTVGTDNTIAIQEIASSNGELKQYVMTKLNGKVLNINGQECTSGTVKLHFRSDASQGYYFQY